MARDLEDAALGAFLGACVGDAAGATLEFLGTPTADDVDRAMAMSGGGFFRLAPGQITDDCDTRRGRLRPQFLHGRRVPELTKALLSAAERSPR